MATAADENFIELELAYLMTGIALQPTATDKNSTKVKLNPLLREIVLRQPTTANWEIKADEAFTLTALNQASTEYMNVQTLLNSTSYGRYAMTITKIRRVENPYLLGQYLLKKEKMEREGSYVHERSLFHGTNTHNIDGICRNNFDWRRRGQSRGHKFGQGVSFSPQASYARHYTHSRLMILAKVLVSNTMIGSVNTIVPPEPYDTTQNAKGSVIVKYEDDDFYPEYVISYV